MNSSTCDFLPDIHVFQHKADIYSSFIMIGPAGYGNTCSATCVI